MKRPNLLSACAGATALLLAVSFTACSAIKRGKVVRKGIEPAGTRMHPGPIYWADVRGENHEGRIVTARIEFFEMDWKTIKKNEWIAPASFGFPRFLQRIHAYNEQQRRESGRFAAGSSETEPRPKTQHRAKSRQVVKRKPIGPTEPPPAPTEQVNAPPATAAPTADERTERLRQVREQAIEDETVRALKQDVRAARSDEEQARAWQKYRAALRDKMHALDPSLGDLIDQGDAAGPR